MAEQRIYETAINEYARNLQATTSPHEIQKLGAQTIEFFNVEYDLQGLRRKSVSDDCDIESVIRAEIIAGANLPASLEVFGHWADFNQAMFTNLKRSGLPIERYPLTGKKVQPEGEWEQRKSGIFVPLGNTAMERLVILGKESFDSDEVAATMAFDLNSVYPNISRNASRLKSSSEAKWIIV